MEPLEGFAITFLRTEENDSIHILRSPAQQEKYCIVSGREAINCHDIEQFPPHKQQKVNNTEEQSATA